MGDFKRVCRVDAFVNEAKPKKNFGPVRWLTLDGAGSNQKFAYLFFPLVDTGIRQNGVTIVSAQLKVFLAEAWAGGPHTVTAKRITQRWKESKINWNNKPNVTTTNSATDSITGGSSGDELLFNVTNMMSMVVAGANWYGIRLEIDTTTARKLHSGETLRDGKRPQLEIVYEINPDPPTRLRPNNEEGVISLAAPTFSWDFNTDDIEESQGESRVIVYDDEALTSVEYDSGWEVNTETEWDSSLDGGGAPSLANLTQYWWTVTVRDSSGNESEPSDAATFWREARGTVTIDEPTADNDNVDTTSPTIEWSLSAGNQMRWKAFLDERKEGGRWRRLTEEALVDGVVMEWFIEPGWIRYPEGEADYRVTVRVWDEAASNRVRIATPGDPTYLEDIRIFQYQPSESVDPPEDFLVTHDGAGLLLSWHRDDVPDDFVISENGRVRKVLDPADVSVGGGDYEWRTYEYDPQANVTWRVRAVVNDQTSAADTYQHTTDLVGAWLVDIDDEVELFLAGQTNFNTQIGETGNTFFPIGRRAPVRIVDSVRGLEGTLQGRITEYDGVTAEQWYDRAVELKGRAPGTVFRLIYGRHNFPVVIGEMTIDQDAGPEHQHDVDIPFWQVGDFDIDLET